MQAHFSDRTDHRQGAQDDRERDAGAFGAEAPERVGVLERSGGRAEAQEALCAWDIHTHGVGRGWGSI